MNLKTDLDCPALLKKIRINHLNMLNLEIFNKSYESNWLFVPIFFWIFSNMVEETKILEGFF